MPTLNRKKKSQNNVQILNLEKLGKYYQTEPKAYRRKRIIIREEFSGNRNKNKIDKTKYGCLSRSTKLTSL